MGDKRDAYVEKLKSKIDDWNVEIDMLEVKAGKAKEDARAQYRKQIEELKKNRAYLESKLKVLKKAGDEAWQDMKAGVDVAWKALGASIQKAKTRFKS